MDTSVPSSTSGVGRGAWWCTLIGLALLLAWDAAGADLQLARLAAPGGDFDLQEQWPFAGPLHAGVRQLTWALALWLLAGLWWPTGVLRRIPRSARLQWLAGMLLGLLLVSAHFMSHPLWTAWICWAASIATQAVAHLAARPTAGIRAAHD
ncbi:MAG: hypothetical protein LH617_03055, partial [Ramlibacter sp.]|nr:hypothetical protein [Ramlibacter sp.]